MLYILVIVLLEKSYFKDRFFFAIIFAKNLYIFGTFGSTVVTPF